MTGEVYRGADKSFARTGRKQARKHVRRRARFQQHRDASCHQVFFFARQGKAPKEIHAILTETLACFLPGRAKYLSAINRKAGLLVGKQTVRSRYAHSPLPGQVKYYSPVFTCSSS